MFGCVVVAWCFCRLRYFCVFACLGDTFLLHVGWIVALLFGSFCAFVVYCISASLFIEQPTG